MTAVPGIREEVHFESPAAPSGAMASPVQFRGDGFWVQYHPGRECEATFETTVPIIGIEIDAGAVSIALNSDKWMSISTAPYQIYCYPKGASLRVRKTAPISYILIAFDFGLEDTPVFGEKKRWDAPVLNGRSARLPQIVRKFRTFCYRDLSFDDRKRLRPLLLDLASAAFDGVVDGGSGFGASGVRQFQPGGLQRILSFIEMNLSESFSISDLAQATTGLSEFHFSRCFKASTGLSPHQYVLERRISAACLSFCASDTTQADIAYGMGFSSQSHFIETFRRQRGVSPHQYRRRLRH